MVGIAVNGGAGRYPEALRADAIRGVRRACEVGWDALEMGALEAAVSVVRFLESDPNFNAGRCSFPNVDGTVEMDAMVMTDDLRLGAVAALREVRHPIDAALAVLLHSGNTFLVGDGARRFALEHGVEPCSNDELVSREQLARWGLDVDDTVGTIALDRGGRMAVALSSGGTPRKRPGRVGDVPLAGSSGYIVKGSGAAVCTGVGEDIMRVLLASRAVAHLGDGPEAAARRAIAEMVELVGGRAGVVVMDVEGRVGAGFNTGQMPWAFITDAGEGGGGA
ncbi:MAG: isoaspartyl peptidase/L-asparaginase [Thermoplasmata archaeon]|nr:isoaspartyl peptidase/L-asparaginase [Thermoplasmata archaeon]